MNKYQFIEKLLNIAYKNTLCLNKDFKIKNAKEMTLLFIKEKNKKLKILNKDTIEYIRKYQFN